MLFMALAVGTAYAGDVKLNAVGGNGKVDLSWTVSGDIRAVQVMRDTDSSRNICAAIVAAGPGCADSHQAIVWDQMYNIFHR